jgi:exodeoxyribonuclease-1
MREGLPEYEFIRKIHDELNTPGTCGVGYNSIRFDDEVTRYSLYRNFYDPYEREWRNGNSRWDIIDMVRLVYALRPDGIEWPIVDGKPSFRLELLTEANGISHAAAHDAYSDVEATIHFAKLIKTKKPQLYNYVCENRGKRAVSSQIDIRNKKPLLHISSMFSAERGCAALVVPLAEHPTNKNAVIAFDLSCDPAPLEKLSAEDIVNRVFVATDALPEGVTRLPLKLIHLNKCPVLAPAKMLDTKVAARLGINRDLCEKHWQSILTMELEYKLRSVYKSQQFSEKTDPEQKLYDGFIGDADKHTMRSIRDADQSELADQSFVFDDLRLNEILFRYKARNFPESLSESENAQWREHVCQRLHSGDENVLSLTDLNQKIHVLKQDVSDDKRKLEVLNALEDYASELNTRFSDQR